MHPLSVKERRIIVKEKYLCMADSHLRSFREYSAKTHRGGGLGDSRQEGVHQDAEAAYVMEKNMSGPEMMPSHVDESVDFREKQEMVNNFVEAGLIGYTAPTLRGLVVHNPAQAKFYTKLHVSLPYLENFQDVETGKYMVAFLDDLFSHCLPPNTDPSPPLMWWDSIRYWVHGQATVVVKKLIYSQARQVSQGLNAPLTVEVSMRKLLLFIDRQSFELNGSDLIITVESKDTQKNMLSMRRVTSRRANLGGDAASSSSGGGGGSSRGGFSTRPKLQPPKQILRWNLCNIPCMSLSIANTPATHHADTTPNNVFSNGLYDHHDVYCRPAVEDTDINRKTLSTFDKYAHFRMKRKSSKWGMLINFNDSPDNVILLFFRLDIIERLKTAFATPAVDVTDDAFHQIVTLQEDTHNFLFGENHDEDYSLSECDLKAKAERKQQYLVARKRYADSLVTDITMCITDLDLHVKLDRFLACSWLSSLILDGTVFSQDSLRVDTQLVNQDVEEGGELEPVRSDSKREGEGGRANGGTDGYDHYQHPTTSLQLKHIDGSIERIEVYLRGNVELIIYIYIYMLYIHGDVFSVLLFVVALL
jgi:hypothetical protein